LKLRLSEGFRRHEAVPFDQPGRVVGFSERQQRLPEFFDRVEGSDPEQVLLERPDKPLGTAGRTVVF
jgi:hypothetical protein